MGEDKIGESPLFQVFMFETEFTDSTGRTTEPAVFDNGEHRVNMVTGFSTGDLQSLGAEFYSESHNIFQLADPRRGGSLNGQTGRAMVIAMKGANLGQQVT